MANQRANSEIHSTDKLWRPPNHSAKLLPILADILFDLQQTDSDTTQEYLAEIIAEVVLGEKRP